MAYPTHGYEFHERLLANDVTDGDHASRPDPEDVAEGHLYACSDHGLVYQSDGATTWATWFDPSAGAPGAHAHSGADITSGTVADARVDAALARDAEVTAAVAAHSGDAADAHDASAISVVPFGTIAATDVQAALEEVAAEAGGGGLTPASYTITNDGTDRAFDADSITLNELADVVATIVRDLGGA